MRKILLVIFIFLSADKLKAQVKPVSIGANKVIVPAKATIVRQEVTNLQVHLAQMSDSLSAMKKMSSTQQSIVQNMK